MTTSAARIEANRKNSLLSTGPRTPEGKARARANALKEGFTATELRTPEDQLAAAPFAGSDWMTQEVAVIMSRIDRLQEIEDRDRERVQQRAETSWSFDKMVEVEFIARDLTKRPSEVVSRLTGSPQGCEWMIGRWAKLARIADAEKGWDDAAKSLANDLMGVPHELRKGHLDETIVGDAGAFARGQIQRLTELSQRLAPLDEFDRETALLGLHRCDSPADRRHRSYEQALHRRLKLFVERIDQGLTLPEPAPEIEVLVVEEAPAEIEDLVEKPEEENEANLEESPEENEANLEPQARPSRRARKLEQRRAAADRKFSGRRELAPADLVSSCG